MRKVRLSALAHPYRLCIVKNLIEKECNVSISRSAWEFHKQCIPAPKQTKAAGIIKGRRCGNEICYKVVDETAVNIINILFKEE